MFETRLSNYTMTAGATTCLTALNTMATAGIVADDNAVVLQAGDDVALFSIGGRQLNAFNYSTSDYLFDSAGFSASGNFYWKVGEVGGSVVDSGFVFTGSEELLRSYEPPFTGGRLLYGNHIIALAFEVAGASSASLYYGWIDYTLTRDNDEYTLTVNSWAYNDVAGEGIIAGQNTAAGSNAVPGLGGLAALAVGAAGVRSRRQRTLA